MNYQAIVFDLDGVLIDSKLCMKLCWSEVQEKIKTEVSFDQYFQNIGKPFKTILSELGIPPSHWKEIETIYFAAQIKYSNHIKPYDGIDTMMNKIKEKYLIGLVTSKNSKATSFLLNKFKWHFSQVITPENCAKGKPNPDPLLYFAFLEQLEPSECLYIGDMVVDFKAAKAAKFGFLRAGWGYQEFKAKSVDSPSNLSKLLEK